MPININHIVPIETAPSLDYTNMVSRAFEIFYNKENGNDYNPLETKQKPAFRTENYSAYLKPDVPNHNSLIYKYAVKYNLDPLLVESVVKAESSNNVKAKSNKGALGLMQIMPTTSAEIARELGKSDYNILDPETNIEFGTYYLRKMVNRYKGDIVKGLAAYNAGAGNVDEYNGVPPFEETQKYITKILRNYNIAQETEKDIEKHGLRKYYINNYQVILHPDIADRVIKADQMMKESTGKGIVINSSYRSYTQQKEIYDRSKGGIEFKAAAPGKSNHQFGRAIDVDNYREAAPYLKAVGLINPMSDDRVHFSLTGR